MSEHIKTWRERLAGLDKPTDFAEAQAAKMEAADLRRRVAELERAQHAGEAREPVAWYRWSELCKKRFFTDEQPTEELAWVPLYAAPQPAALPEGWKPVPDLMTREMMRAWFETDPGPALATGGLSYFQPRYAAMLAAAPQPREWDASATPTAGEKA